VLPNVPDPDINFTAERSLKLSTACEDSERICEIYAETFIWNPTGWQAETRFLSAVLYVPRMNVRVSIVLKN
jgi:hypothetical protein